MAALKSFLVSGQELAPFVTRWANVERVKDVLLAKSTLLVGELQLECSNVNQQFSPEAVGSLLYGRNLFNQPCQVAFDGDVLFQGFLKDVTCDHQRRTATFIMADLLTIPADAILQAQTLTGGPGAVMLGLVRSVNLLSYVDVNSFLAASGSADAAGATITYTVASDSSDSLLQALQAIAELGSISVYVASGLIRARAFQPYAGNGSNLRQLLSGGVVRQFGSRTTAFDNFNNSVTVGYNGGKWKITNPVSIGLTGLERNFPFSTEAGNALVVSNLTSAKYFAALALARMSKPPVTIDLTCGPDLMHANLGDRFPVTAPNWGYVKAPFELIESHHEIEKNDVQMVLRSLF